jgi:hypothetical protein
MAALVMVAMAQKRLVLIDEPGPYGPNIEEWEIHLRMLESLPADVWMRDELIERARRMIERKATRH